MAQATLSTGSRSHLVHVAYGPEVRYYPPQRPHLKAKPETVKTACLRLELSGTVVCSIYR